MRGRGPVSATLYFCGEPANARIAAIVRDNLRPLRIDVTPAPSLDCLQGPDPKAAAADLLLVTRVDSRARPGAVHAGHRRGHRAVRPRRRARHVGRRGVQRSSSTGRGDSLRRAGWPSTRGSSGELLRGPAPYAAFASFVAPEYRSARVGCPLVQGAYEVLDLAALCPRSPG